MRETNGARMRARPFIDALLSRSALLDCLRMPRRGWIPYRCDPRKPWDRLLEQLQPFGAELSQHNREPGDGRKPAPKRAAASDGWASRATTRLRREHIPRCARASVLRFSCGLEATDTSFHRVNRLWPVTEFARPSTRRSTPCPQRSDWPPWLS